MTLPTIVSFVAASSPADTTNTVISLPTNAAGDMIFVAISSDLPDEVYTAPTNYATVYPIINIRSAASNKASAALFYKQSTGSEPSTITVPQTLADKQSWAVLVVRGANGIHNKSNPPTWGDSALASIPSIVTTVADCLLMAIIATDGNTTPHTGATNYTKRAESTTSGASSISLWTNTAPTAGTQAADSVSMPTEQWIGYTLALSENYTIAISDLVTISESVSLLVYSPGVTVNASVSDSATVTDQIAALVSTPNGSVSENVSVSESVVTSVTTPAQVSDTVTLSESATVSPVNVRVTVADSISVGEQANASIPGVSNTQIVINDAVTITEQVTLRPDLYLLSVTDAVTITETVNTGNTIPLTTNSETVTLSESVALILRHQISISETITLTDAVTLLSRAIVEVSDTLTVSETSALRVPTSIAVVDTVTITETVSYGDKFLISVSESITLTDSVIIPEILLVPTLRDYRIGTDSANTFATVMGVPTALAKDFIFIAITSDANNEIFTPPAGFVLITASNIANTASYAIFYKLSTGVEPSTYTVGVSISERQSWVVFSVANAAVPINALSAGTSFGNDNLPQIPEITTTVDDCLVLGFIATNGYPAPYHNNGIFYNEQYEAGGSSAGSMSVWQGHQAIAGTVTTESISATTVQPWNGFALALAPLINRLVFPSDIVTFTETVSLIVSDPQAQTADTITITETITTTLFINVNANDSITLTDSDAAERFYNITLGDPVALSEQIGAITSTPKINVSQNITVTETRTVFLVGSALLPSRQDSITVGELITVIIAGAGAANPFRCQCAPPFRGRVYRG